MDKLWKTISGLFCAAVMTVTLPGRAKAENDEAVLPEPAPAAVVEPAVDTPAVSAEEGSDENSAAPEEETIPAEEETFFLEEETAPVEDETVFVEEYAPVDEEIASFEEEIISPEEETDSVDEEAAPIEEETVSAEAEPAPAAGESVSSDEEIDPVEAEAAPIEEETVSAEAEPAPAAGESVFSDEEIDPVEAEAAPAEGENEENETEAEMSPAPILRSDMVTAKAEVLNDPASAEEDDTDRVSAGDDEDGESEKKGVDPEKSSPDELVLVGNSRVQDVISQKDIIIKTAGLQHISSLISDGDVYIVGTGILLVDDLDLLQGRSVFLQSFEEIYGENGGTAALFVFTGEENGVRTYELFNGTYLDAEGEHLIPAILDEVYELPSGINLVVPDGGSMVMQCVNTLVETVTGEDGEDVTTVTHSTTGSPVQHYPVETEGYRFELISTAPVLTISEGSRLEVRPGASFRLNHLPKLGVGQFINSPLINISGTLALGGDITGGLVHILESGDVAGCGAFVNSDDVTVYGRSTPVTNINAVGGGLVFDEGAYIDSLKVTGSCYLVSNGDWTANSLTVNDGTLTSYNKGLGSANTFTITDTISGSGTVYLFAGNILLAGGADACSAVITDNNHLGYVYNPDEGILRYDFTTESLQKAPLIPLVGTASQADGQVSIPVAEADILHTAQPSGFGSTSSFENLAVFVDSENHPVTYTCASGAELSYQDIDSILGGGLGNYEFMAETFVNGAYGYMILSSGSTVTVTASDVVQIIRENVSFFAAGDGGSTLTSTDTSFTGSGILGGSGAGSMSGGARRLAVSGNRGTPINSVPEKDPADDSTPGDDLTPEDDPAPTKFVNDLRVWTEAALKDGCFVLHIQIGGETVLRLETPVKVRMAYTPGLGMASKPLYAVFRNADGTLTAFAAYYDAIMGILSFNSDIAGEFIIVAFDFEGEPFTDEFYQALAGLDDVKTLIA